MKSLSTSLLADCDQHTHPQLFHSLDIYVSQCILLSIGNTTCSYLLDEEPRVTGSSQYGGLLQAVLKDGLESRTQRASDQVIHCLSYSVISSQRVLNDKSVCMRQLSHLSPINRNSDTIQKQSYYLFTSFIQDFHKFCRKPA